MSLFISDAWAQSAGSPVGGGMELILMMAVFFAIMYFMIIRPQQKRTKEHKTMLEALNKGDEVVTGGGLLGKITKIDDNFIQIEISEGVNIKVQKHAIASVMPKGTLKSA
ncbi:MAG: preprotein translocase subunit YajC [Proteobacteria bacterium]|nr:MAG: preprotein translocase subunit YajC [Pseudomonadota bacterium]